MSIGNKKDFICDTKKDKLEINSFNLLSTDFTTKIKYTKLGTIVSSGQTINDEIKSIINLNDENLLKARVQVYQAIDFIKKNSKKEVNLSRELKKK